MYCAVDGERHVAHLICISNSDGAVAIVLDDDLADRLVERVVFVYCARFVMESNAIVAIVAHESLLSAVPFDVLDGVGTHNQIAHDGIVEMLLRHCDIDGAVAVGCYLIGVSRSGFVRELFTHVDAVYSYVGTDNPLNL